MAKQAPFDVETGDMVSWPGSSYHNRFHGVEMRSVEPFEAQMMVVGMETGRSAKRLILRDLRTGKNYPMFVADVVKYLQNQVLDGTWEACKRGQNYGIRTSG